MYSYYWPLYKNLSSYQKKLKGGGGGGGGGGAGHGGRVGYGTCYLVWSMARTCIGVVGSHPTEGMAGLYTLVKLLVKLQKKPP